MPISAGIQSLFREWVAAKRCRCEMDLLGEMGLIAEFMLWMAFRAQCWQFQEQRMRDVVAGFRHQANFFLEPVMALAARLSLRVVVNCRDSSRVHFMGVD
jgi:hypothetical protein